MMIEYSDLAVTIHYTNFVPAAYFNHPSDLTTFLTLFNPS